MNDWEKWLAARHDDDDKYKIIKVLYKLSIISTLHHIPFSATDALTAKTNWNVTAPKWPVRQLQYVVYMRSFMIAQ